MGGGYKNRDERDPDDYHAPPPVMSRDDIDWVHDKRAEERLRDAWMRKLITWIGVIGAAISSAIGALTYFKGGGGHTP